MAWRRIGDNPNPSSSLVPNYKTNHFNQVKTTKKKVQNTSEYLGIKVNNDTCCLSVLSKPWEETLLWEFVFISYIHLIYWGRDWMVAIFQMAYSNAFSWIKIKKKNFADDFTVVSC